MTEKAIKTTKGGKLQERLGWLALGACIDYFIFKPVRYFRPIILFVAGFGLGVVASNWGKALVDALLK